MFPPSIRSAFGVSPATSVPSGQGQNDIVGDFLNRVLPALRSDRAQRMNDEFMQKIKEMNYARTGGRLPLPGTPEVTPQGGTNTGNAQPNVVAQGMTPYDAARIALQQQAEQGKNKRAEESIAGRENIASQAESGRSSRAQLRSDTAKTISDDKLKLGMKNLGLKQEEFDHLKMIKDLPDSERLKMVQNGQITMEDLKHVHTIEAIDERGIQNIANTETRGDISAKNQANKKLTPQQQGAAYENTARQLKSENPDYAKYIQMDPTTNKFKGVVMPSGGDPNTLHEINRRIYGDDPKKLDTDIELPKDQSSVSDKMSTGPGQTDDLSDTSPAQVTQYQKGDDPLGILGDSSDARQPS